MEGRGKLKLDEGERYKYNRRNYYCYLYFGLIRFWGIGRVNFLFYIWEEGDLLNF